MDEESRYSHRIWRALDASQSFFGIKGRYKTVFLLTAAAGMLPAALVWDLLGDMLGFILCMAVLVLDYMWIIWLQTRMSERQFTRMMGKINLKRFSRVRPMTVRDNLKKDIEWK